MRMAERHPGAVRPDVGQREGHGEAQYARAHLFENDRPKKKGEGRGILDRLPILMGVEIDVPEAEDQR